jgi:hypothetical protein
MKQRIKPVIPMLITAWLVACVSVLTPVCAMGLSSINFANNGSCCVTNGVTGNPVRAEDGFQAALFYAPIGFAVSAFLQNGPAVPVGKPVPGIFAGGTRLTDSAIAPGNFVQVQVRAWPAAFPTYQDAVSMGAAVGSSAVMVVTTGDSGTQPLVPPPSLTAGGLQGFTINGFWQLPPTTTNLVLTTPLNTPVTIDIATVFSAITENDGDVLSIIAVDSQSAHAGAIAANASTLTYTPPINFQGNDIFSVRFSDGLGGFAAVPITILVSGGITPATNQISIDSMNGHTVISFGGTPDQNYVIQYAPTVSGPWTDLSGKLAVGANFVMGYNDLHPVSTTRFYRVITK